MFQDMNQIRRALVGFDRIFNEVAHTNNYPPYNLVKVDEDNFFVELAVAGFAKEELEIETKDNRLYIRGSQTVHHDHDYVHQGIARRDFERNFVLADHVVVKNAGLKDGILRVELTRIVPEELKPKKVDIQ